MEKDIVTKQSENYTILDVVGTLHDGRILSKSKKILLKTLIGVLVLFICFITLALLILMFEHKEIETYEIAILIFALVIVIILKIICCFILLKDKKLITKCQLCLKDAVYRKAYSRSVYPHDFMMSRDLRVKLEIKFIINKVKHVQTSGERTKNPKFNGYRGCWRHYANKEIEILYSPKYDEILILRD